MSSIKIELDTLEQLVTKMEELVNEVKLLEDRLSEPKFYTIKDAAELTGWSIVTMQEIFNRRDFPSCDFGKRKIVEASAFKQYFSVPRRK